MTDLFAHTGVTAREGEHAHDPGESSTDMQLARADWRKTIQGGGGVCPCCDRWGKVYARSINKTMARSLIWLAHHSADGTWMDVPKTAPKWLLRSNQLATLRWWGLVQRKPSADDEDKHSGMWRATKAGKAFANNEIAVPKKAFTYNGEVEGFSEETITVDKCVERFNYHEVMEETSE